MAREAADLVLLDDNFGTIVVAIELGRASFANIRRFLTCHLTDNVAELTPFVLWALSGGSIPVALTVLQVLALDIGTDMLPVLALGAEPPNRRTTRGPLRNRGLIDRTVALRAFGLPGPAEAALSMAAFFLVLVAGGWRFGVSPSTGLLITASGTAFAAIVLGQVANVFTCRSESRWIGRIPMLSNKLVPYAVVCELVLLGLFLAVPPFPELLGGGVPNLLGWGAALLTVPAVIRIDATYKGIRAHRIRHHTAKTEPSS